MDATGKTDLREVCALIQAVKDYAADTFGFQSYLVDPTWVAATPAEGCGFSVLGAEYEAAGGVLTAVTAGE